MPCWRKGQMLFCAVWICSNSTMINTVVLIKPRAQQARWIDALSQHGFAVEALPLLITEPLPETAAQRTVWLNLDQYHGIVVVSPSAAEIVLDRLDTYWPQPPVGIQ